MQNVAQSTFAAVVGGALVQVAVWALNTYALPTPIPDTIAGTLTVAAMAILSHFVPDGPTQAKPPAASPGATGAGPAPAG